MKRQVGYVQERGTAAEISAIVEGTLLANRTLPDQVFGPPYTFFAFFDYAVLQNYLCWLELLRYANTAALLHLSPSSEDIFSRSGGTRHGIVQLHQGIKEQELRILLSTSPTANPADAFILGCMRCAVVVEGRDCAIFGDRLWDLAVAAFSSQASRERFRDCTPSWPFMNVVDAAERVTAQSKPRDRSDFVAALKANYANAVPLF
jgi:hypothetical protein